MSLCGQKIVGKYPLYFLSVFSAMFCPKYKSSSEAHTGEAKSLHFQPKYQKWQLETGYYRGNHNEQPAEDRDTLNLSMASPRPPHQETERNNREKKKAENCSTRQTTMWVQTSHGWSKQHTKILKTKLKLKTLSTDCGSGLAV